MSRPSSQTGSSSFSDPTKLEVLRLAGPNCWACNTRDPQFAHVIAQTDTQVGDAAVLSWILKLTHYHVQKEVWEKCELINFSYSSPANSVPLCPSCHAQFDNSADPGFVFFPTDLNFFINYELHDRQRRQQGGVRKTPSASDYKDHQVRECKVSSLTPGGLYRRVFLKDYLHDGILSMDMLQMFASDKSWHGDPIASLRRAIGMLGSARIGILDANILRQLHQLQDLYFSDSVSPRLSLLYRHKMPEKRPHDDSDNEDDGQHKRRSFLQDSARRYDDINAPQSTDTSQKDPARNPGDIPQSSDASQACDWVLGPQSSTNEIIKRFAPVFSHPDIIHILSTWNMFGHV